MQTPFTLKHRGNLLPADFGVIGDIALCHDNTLFHALLTKDIEVGVSLFEQGCQISDTLKHSVLRIALGLI
jgi:hypothetical protein